MAEAGPSKRRRKSRVRDSSSSSSSSDDSSDNDDVKVVDEVLDEDVEVVDDFSSSSSLSSSDDSSYNDDVKVVDEVLDEDVEVVDDFSSSSSLSSSDDTSYSDDVKVVDEVLDEDVEVVDDFSSDNEVVNVVDEVLDEDVEVVEYGSSDGNEEDDDDDNDDNDDDDVDEDWQPSNVQPDILGQGISLCTMLKGRPDFSNNTQLVQLVCREVLETLKCNELNGKVHGSVNPCNIWLYPNGQVRLYKPRRNVRQHRAYRAPEAIEYGSSHESELYSLGVLAIVLLDIGSGLPEDLSGYVEVTDAERAETRSFFQTLLPRTPPRMRNFLQLCLNDNPSERKTAAVLISTPWMQGVKCSYAEELGEWVRTFPVEKFPPRCTCDSKTAMRQASIVRDEKGKPVRQWKRYRFFNETEREYYKEFIKENNCSHKSFAQNAPEFDAYRRKWMCWIRNKSQQHRTTTRTMADYDNFNPEQKKRWLNYVRGKQLKRGKGKGKSAKGQLLYNIEERLQDRLHGRFNVPRTSAASGGSSQQAKVGPLAHLNQRWKIQRCKIKQEAVYERKRKVERFDRKKNTEMSEKEKRGAKRKIKIEAEEEEEEEDERDNRKKRRDQ